MNEQHKVVSSIGENYRTYVQVSLKNDIQLGLNTSVVDGLLARYQEKPPYHIGLRSKYTIKLSRDELVNFLTDDTISPLKKHLEDDKDFFKEFSESEDNKGKNICTTDDAFREAKKLLVNIKDAKSLTTNLEEKLDLANYIATLISVIREKKSDLEYYQTGGGLSYISGDAISAVKVIRYDTEYSIIVKEYNKEIPRAYDFPPHLWE